jgi:hypothetical protein
LLVIAAVALLRPARADTPSRDWGTEWYQRRADEFLRFMRSDLLRQEPDPAPHSRFFFVRVPSNVGFLAGDGPALRVWYRDSTLTGGYYGSYRPRPPERGPDHFFRYDSTLGWTRIVPGSEDVASARQANPRWEIDHATLANALANAGDWPRALIEFEKLARADSASAVHAYNVGFCHESLGDSAAAATWYARSAALPGATPEMRQAALEFAGHLRPRRQRAT